MKERYLSKTPNVTFVYLSKCNIKLPGFFGNSKKRFLWTGLVTIHPSHPSLHKASPFSKQASDWSQSTSNELKWAKAERQKDEKTEKTKKDWKTKRQKDKKTKRQKRRKTGTLIIKEWLPIAKPDWPIGWEKYNVGLPLVNIFTWKLWLTLLLKY